MCHGKEQDLTIYMALEGVQDSSFFKKLRYNWNNIRLVWMYYSKISKLKKKEKCVAKQCT